MSALRLAQDFGAYLYDVFWTHLDGLVIFGIAAQFLFAARFIVQWLASERAGRSVMPLAFWFFSVAGGFLTLVYGLLRREPVIILGQALSVFIYIRNLVLIFRERRRQRSLGT
ncbi:MAG: lipid-A-disaccharide synthase N-terminal domain-containing protein [Candidatus Methylomirabilota bacterium]